MSVSVAMTTFNGDKYIDEQIKSILIQLDMEDELIISDDGSTDNTVQILKQYSEEYDNIKLHLNNRLGVVKNFEFAIKECTKDIIVLSDQDDIWVDNKLVEIKKHFSKNSNLLILHNAIKFNSDQGNDYGSGELMIKKMRKGLVANVLKSCYWGCCMAFRKELVDYIIPFPESVVAHDQWIGIVAEDLKSTAFIDKPLIYHRLHQNNVTKKLSLYSKVNFRFQLTKAFLVYRFR